MIVSGTDGVPRKDGRHEKRALFDSVEAAADKAVVNNSLEIVPLRRY